MPDSLSNNAHTSIYTYIIYRKRLALILFANIIICAVLMVVAMQAFHSKLLASFFLFAVFIPFLWLHKLTKYFTRIALFKLGSGTILLRTTPMGKPKITELQFLLKSIDYYIVKSPGRKFTVIQFKLKSGKLLEYSFFTSRINENEKSGKEIIEIFNSFIKCYNVNNVTNRITIKPSFIASKNGLIFIYFMVCLYVTAIVLHVIYKVNPAGLLISAALIFELTASRIQEKRFYSEMK